MTLNCGPGPVPCVRISLCVGRMVLVAGFGIGLSAWTPASPAFAARLEPALRHALPRVAPNTRLHIWIDLDGKRDAVPAPGLVTPRSLQRRARARPDGPLVDSVDLPIDPVRVASIAALGVRIRERSRWLNAISVEATRTQIEILQNLPQVRSLGMVARTRPPSLEPALDSPSDGERIHGPGYGPSEPQLQLIRADVLHDRGLYGLGVLVAHFDTGYPLLPHEVFRTLRIAGAYDFLDHDAAPWDPPADPSDVMTHGQYTLSVIAGFKPGKLVGVAPGASYLLARTESSAAEIPSEEDHWIAALEWADSLGADIVTSSLRFLGYDDPWVGYSWEDMNGATARVTRAADLAARRGILVVQGAGNEGLNYSHNTLVAPADGKEVLAIGAVGPHGARADFSSVGPTTDIPERIKPDLMAPGYSVVAADIENDSSYTLVSGTSLSTPLAAGVAALLLSVHPATPAQLRDALRLTATQASFPDNLMGWGIIDAEAAYEYLVRLFPSGTDGMVVVRPVLRFPNPFPRSAAIACEIGASGPVSLRVYDALGHRVRSLVNQELRAGLRTFAWDGADDAGLPLSRGVYFIELRAATADHGTAVVTRKLALRP